LIGLERQYRQRTAGLRTNVLVAVGAASFVDVAERLQQAEGAVHVLAYVVSGVGFLGAGAIMRDGGSVHGLNTAATLWGAAAVGACAGADLVLEATVVAVFVLAANTLLRPVVNRLSRVRASPTSETINTVYAIARREGHQDIVALVRLALEQANYPIANLAIHAFGRDEVEIEATLSASSVEGAELDAVVKRLAAESGVRQVFWSPRSTA
jgi:putative Mg2+ transporter-C (MgtC) family protein